MLQRIPGFRMRSASPALWTAAFLLLLGASVVLWGTAYKLSLYHPDDQHGDMPAKLCTRLSDIAKDNVQLATTQPAHAPDAEVVVAMVQEPAMPLQLRWMPKEPSHKPLPSAARPQHLLRPPPASVRADV